MPVLDSAKRKSDKSIATVSLSGTLEQKLAAAAEAGFTGVELLENDLINCLLSPADVRQLADHLGLELVLYQPFRDFEAVPDEMFQRNMSRAEQKFSLMERLGISTILVCSSVASDSIDDDELAAEQLSQLADRARERGLRVAYEALAWGRHVNDYEHSWRIVSLADHPHLGVCLDTFHILSRGSSDAGIKQIPGDKIFFLQLADAPSLTMDVLQWSRHYRCFPGQGAFPLLPLVQAVRQAGYRGPLSLEVFNDIFRQADPRRTAIDAMRSLVALEEALVPSGEGDGSSVGSSAGAPPPRPPGLTGYAFIELAVDQVSLPQTEHLLSTIGFGLVGRHRSKPVQMWRGGTASVLLNSAIGVSDPALGDVRVAAIGLDSANPTESARRAEGLLAPILPRSRGPREADISAIAAADGISLFFCREEAGGRAWTDDFLRTESSRAGTSELIGVDHVALSQPFDSFDEAALFYQSVLGLRPQQSHEVAGPLGLIRSRGVKNPDGQIRIALSAPVLGGGPGAARHPQHVAFACRDIFRCASWLRERGLPTLPISDNYYDDLLARTELPAAMVDTMRDYGVVYDSDAGGEFLHFYTGMVGAGLFFEFVERRGSYDGYGAINSPVRMTAQQMLSDGALTLSGVLG